MISLLQNNEAEHGPVVYEFVKWCDEAFFQLNTTKDMVLTLKAKSNSCTSGES